jgi:hypothetical protein
MYRDPIVEEVRKHRQQNAAKFGYDIRAIAEDARKRQATSGHPVVDLSREGTRPAKRRAARKSFREARLARSGR